MHFYISIKKDFVSICRQCVLYYLYNKYTLMNFSFGQFNMRSNYLRLINTRAILVSILSKHIQNSTERLR